MNITPTNDLLVIRQIVEEEPKTSWGLLLPPNDESSETPCKGVVVFAGNGRRPKLSKASKDVVAALRKAIDLLYEFSPISDGKLQELESALLNHENQPARVQMTVKSGDTVIFSKHGFQTFRINGEDLIVTQEASILGIVE